MPGPDSQHRRAVNGNGASVAIPRRPPLPAPGASVPLRAPPRRARMPALPQNRTPAQARAWPLPLTASGPRRSLHSRTTCQCPIASINHACTLLLAATAITWLQLGTPTRSICLFEPIVDLTARSPTPAAALRAAGGAGQRASWRLWPLSRPPARSVRRPPCGLALPQPAAPTAPALSLCSPPLRRPHWTRPRLAAAAGCLCSAAHTLPCCG